MNKSAIIKTTTGLTLLAVLIALVVWFFGRDD